MTTQDKCVPCPSRCADKTYNRNAAILLVLARVRQASVTSIGHGNDTGGRNQGVRQRRLAMIDMSNNRHVPDVVLLVHDLAHLVHRKVHHDGRRVGGNAAAAATTRPSAGGRRTSGRRGMGDQLSSQRTDHRPPATTDGGDGGDERCDERRVTKRPATPRQV